MGLLAGSGLGLGVLTLLPALLGALAPDLLPGPGEYNGVLSTTGPLVSFPTALARCEGPLPLTLLPAEVPSSRFHTQEEGPGVQLAWSVHAPRPPATVPDERGRFLEHETWLFRLPALEPLLPSGGGYHRAEPGDVPGAPGLRLVEVASVRFLPEDLPGPFLLLLRVGDGCGRATAAP